MNINTWYYGLSTIAQTLAGILGLGAIFIILGFDSITKEFREYKERGLAILEIKKKRLEGTAEPTRIPDNIKGIVGALEEFWTNYKEKYRTNAGIDADIKKIANEYGRLSLVGDLGFVKYTYLNLKQLSEQRREMVKSVIWPGVITISTIAASLVLLGFSDGLFHISILLVVIISALLSIFLIGKTVWKNLNRI